MKTPEEIEEITTTAAEIFYGKEHRNILSDAISMRNKEGTVAGLFVIFTFGYIYGRGATPEELEQSLTATAAAKQDPPA